jgi:hypothetical protein
MAVLGAIERASSRCLGLAAFATLVVVFEIVTVLVFGAHYPMDVFAGIAAASCVVQPE